MKTFDDNEAIEQVAFDAEVNGREYSVEAMVALTLRTEYERVQVPFGNGTTTRAVKEIDSAKVEDIDATPEPRDSDLPELRRIALRWAADQFRGLL